MRQDTPSGPLSLDLELAHTSDFAKVSPRKIEMLRAMRPGGMLYEPRQVRCWVAKTLPEIEARYPESRTARGRWQRLVNWWKRTGYTEVDAAERWVYQAHVAASQKDAIREPLRAVPDTPPADRHALARRLLGGRRV